MLGISVDCHMDLHLGYGNQVYYTQHDYGNWSERLQLVTYAISGVNYLALYGYTAPNWYGGYFDGVVGNEGGWIDSNFLTVIELDASNHTTASYTNNNFTINPVENFGIGTYSPSAKLSIVTGSADTTGNGFSYIGSNSKEFVSISKVGFIRSRASDTNGANIHFQDNGGTKRMEIAVGTTAMTWYSDALANNFITFQHSTGRVGIGSGSPSQLLHVFGNAEVDGVSSAATLRVSTTNTGAGVATLILANSSKSAFNDGVKMSHGGGYTNITDLVGTNIMTWDMSNTRVGISTTSPVTKLHVEGSAAIGTTGTEDILLLGRALSGGVSFQQAASLKLGRYQNAGGAYESYTRLDFALRDNSAASNYNTNTTVMTLTNASRVGIATTTPGTALEVFSVAPSGDRTLPHNVLTITAEQGNAPYSFFGGSILFKNRSYVSGMVESSRIRSVIYDDGAPNNFGGGIWFETTPTPGGSLTPSLVLNYQGRVGIGTTTPGNTLDVNGSIYLSETGIISGRAYPYTTTLGAGADATTTYIDAGSTAGYRSRIKLAGGSATDPNTIILYTSSSERVRVTAGGDITAQQNLNIGNTALNTTLTFTGASVGGFTNGYIRWNQGVNITSGMSFDSPGCNIEIGTGWNERIAMSTGQGIWIYTNNGSGTYTNRLSLDRSGNLIVSGNMTAYGSPSDRTLKTNIKPLQNSLSVVNRLRGVSFDWKKDTEMSTMTGLKEDFGFIAQEVEEVLPDLVRKNGDGLLSLRDKGLTAFLVEAIKELTTRIEELEKDR
jgi:hypothetical protein